MNTRILQTIWKLQRTSCVRNKLSSTGFVWRSYVTGFNRSTAQVPDMTIHKDHWNITETRKIGVRNFTSDVASKPKKPIQIDNVLQSIDNYYKNNGSVNYDSLCAVLDVLEQDPNAYNQLLDAEQALFLLRACGNLLPAQPTAERLALFKRLWSYLEVHNQLTSEHYLTAIEIRIMNCTALSDYHEFIEKIKNDNAQCVNSELYEQLVRLACVCGDLSQAKEILAEMREKQYGLTEHIFHSLIIGHARNRDLDGLNTVLESMSAANLPPSIETQTMLVCAYLENEKLDLAKDLLEQFKGQFSNAQILCMLKAVTLLDIDVGLEIMEKLVNELPLDFLLGTEVPKPLRNLCIELIRDRKLNAAIALIQLLPTPRFNENQDSDTFAVFLLNEIFRVQIPPPRILEICNMLIDSGKNTRALHVAAEICIRRNPHSVVPFFQAISQKEALRPHYFWPLLMYNFRRWGENGIFRTLKTMSDFGVDCDNDTLNIYALPRLSVTLENPELALKSFVESGVKTSQIITPIMAQMLGQFNLEQPYQIAQLYPSKINCLQLVQPLNNLVVNVRATKRYHQYVKLIHAIAKKSDNPKVDFVGQLLVDILARDTRMSSDVNAIQRLLNEMHKFALQVSIAAAELIGSHLNKNFQDVDLSALHKLLRGMSNNGLTLPNETINTSSSKDSTSSFITHPRDMKRDELECHLIELEAKGLNTRGVLRRLLQLSVRDGKLDRALEIKCKCDELKITISPGMLASIFEMYIRKKDLPNAEASLKQLQQSFPAFHIDEHKILDYAALLVQEKQLDAAKRILSDRAASTKIIGGDYVLKNIWNLLTNIAHLAAKLDMPKEQNLARDTFEFLQHLGYCIPHNTVLGPIVREYLLRNDIRSAVEEYGKLVNLYERTPLQFELLSLLVKLANNEGTADNVSTNEDLQRFAIKAEDAQPLLTSVTEYTSQVYGVQNMNSSLLLAFAESGTEQQLRRLMMDPSFRINETLLLKNCDFLSSEGSVQTLLRLARSARGLHHIISEQNIYDMLLSKLKNSNNYEGALELYERLEADDELKVSQDFINNLVNLLRVNNVEIPSSLALRAKIM